MLLLPMRDDNVRTAGNWNTFDHKSATYSDIFCHMNSKNLYLSHVCIFLKL